MRLLALAATALITSGLSPALAEEIPGTTFSSGYWEGSANTDDQGQFAYCDVDVGYTDDRVLWFVLYPDDSMWILMSKPEVRFQSGQTFDVWLMMEAGVPASLKGESWNDTYAGVYLQGIDDTIGFIGDNKWMRMMGIGIDDGFDVTGATEALAMAKTCVEQNSGTNPFGTKQPSTTSPPPPPKVPDLKPRNNGLGSGGGLGTRPGGALGTPAPVPQP